jgi:uncharacterized protein (TIGR03067 family)
MKAQVCLAVALGLAVLVPIGAAPKGKDDPKDAIKAFEGEWQFSSWEQGGTELPKEFLDAAKWKVKDGKYTFSAGDQTEEGTIKLDPEKKPATLDFEITAGNDKGKTQVGIYKVEKEAITLCLARPGEKDRPTEFSSAGDKGFILIVMKRKDD